MGREQSPPPTTIECTFNCILIRTNVNEFWNAPKIAENSCFKVQKRCKIEFRKFKFKKFSLWSAICRERVCTECNVVDLRWICRNCVTDFKCFLMF